MALSRQDIRDLYRVRAGLYDWTAHLYYLIGFREQHYRKRAVAALDLKEGSTVVEIGCGTGLNFPLLQERIGSSGQIIGVDLTDRMLEKARERVNRKGWANVTLVQSDAARFDFPAHTNAVLSTFAITLIPEYNLVIRNGSDALGKGGRLAILDFKKPDDVPLWLTRIMVRLTSPFGVTLDLADRHPWKSVEKYFPAAPFQDFFFGFVYLSVGKVV